MNIYTSAITLTLPSTDGNKDIILTWPTQVEGNSDLIYQYIQRANEYLRLAMVVLCFAVVVWMWFKVMTNETWTDDAKAVIRKWLIAMWAWLLLIMLSYTIVRIVINIL